MSNRLGRNPFGPKATPAPVAPAAPQTPEFTPAFAPEDEVLELSSLRDFLIKDVPAAALMLAIKGAGRLSAQLSRQDERSH